MRIKYFYFSKKSYIVGTYPFNHNIYILHASAHITHLPINVRPWPIYSHLKEHGRR